MRPGSLIAGGNAKCYFIRPGPTFHNPNNFSEFLALDSIKNPGLIAAKVSEASWTFPPNGNFLPSPKSESFMPFLAILVLFWRESGHGRRRRTEEEIQDGTYKASQIKDRIKAKIAHGA